METRELLVEAMKALKQVQIALACHRDNQDYVHPEHGKICLEEVKYCVVDPVCEKLYQTTDGTDYQSVEATVDGEDLCFETQLLGSDTWVTNKLSDKKFESMKPQEIQHFVGEKLNLFPECHENIDAAYA
jgi:hypothetical protein